VAFRAQLDDFAALYERTYPVMYRTVLGICGDASLAADATQDAYVSAYRQRATFSGEVPVDAWLHRIAVNAALSSLRRRRVRWAEPLDPVRHDRSVAPADRAGGLDLASALLRLDPRSRAAIILRYYVDLDYATIATILETSPGNVGSMLSRAIERLRRDLGSEQAATIIAVAVTEEAGHGR
jgi:RNA polymerase sigma-70 factor (ECF subfamily)